MENKFLLGCCYYPEHWDKDRMHLDIERIKDLGFNTVRMGEFSWSMFEKQEGKYDFSFLLEAVNICAENELLVILGTPTAAPPAWLTEKYPEVLCVNANGATLHHGSRQHHNHTSPIYLKYCAKITQEMVKAFAHADNVIGWQIDNEINCHRNESYAESDDIAFAKWLEEKYGTVEKMNEAWGTRFWSLCYNDFSQVKCPKLITTHKNPSMMTDYYLFLSDACINYADIQAKILKEYMPNAFVTHNGMFQNVDNYKMTQKCLDFMSYDYYPAFSERNGIGEGRKQEYRLACTRGCSEKFLILEQQAGPGGQLSYLVPTPLPGQIRLWTYQSIAHGAVGIFYFRYRTALFGAEQLWYGIYDHDGQENYRSREVREIAEEINRIGNIFLAERGRAEVAIYNDYHNTCVNKAEPFFKDDTWHIYTSLQSKGVHTDIIYSADDFAKYKVVILPHIAIAEEYLVKKTEEFTENGGVVILSSRCGVKDKNAHYRAEKAPGVFKNIAKCRCDWFTSVANPAKQLVEMNGKKYTVDIYCEMLESEGAEIIARYTEGFLKDKAAVTKNGNVYYVGYYTESLDNIYFNLIKDHISPIPEFDVRLERVPLGGYDMYMNHTGEILDLVGHDIIKNRDISQIEPFDVVLFENKS